MTIRPKSDFLAVMIERGYLQDCTDLEGLDARLTAGQVTAYVGYDATARSLHVGHLMIIMMLRWLQKTGHRPITLMGGGTTKVGDPSFRSEERPLLTPDQIGQNIATIRGVFGKYLDYGPGGALMLDNAEWLDGLNYLGFLRDIGRHFSVNRMLSFESVKSRLDRDQSLSFLEFNYMILQAYDFLELYRREGCILQMGGSDQWGNIVNGIDLARRVVGAELFGLTSPLLATADGAKMGKTAGGAVWLNAEALAPYDFWQYWRNTADADVGRFLKLYTELPVAECDRLGRLGGAEINAAKIVLANEATTLCHGAEAAAAAEATAREVFERGGVGDELPTLTLAAGEIPEGGIPIVQLLVRAGLAASGKDARRLIAEGGARLDDVALSDVGLHLDAGALAAPRKLSAGRKRHALVRLEPQPADLPRPMLGAIGAALMAVPDAVGLGIEAMGFSGDAFRRVAAGPDRDLVVLIVYLAGISLGIGNGVVLFLNRVPRLRFVLSLALTGAIHLVGALVTTATALLVADLVVGRDLDFVPTLAVIALAQAPLLLGFLTLAPYFGELVERFLDVWVLTLVLFGLHQGLGMTLQGAALLALLGWASTRVLTFVLGRPMTRVVNTLRRAAAGGPLTLDSRNLIDTLKAEARGREGRRSRDR